MMKKQIALVALLFLGMSCFNASAQFKKFNLGKAIQAGKEPHKQSLYLTPTLCYEQGVYGMDGQA